MKFGEWLHREQPIESIKKVIQLETEQIELLKKKMDALLTKKLCDERIETINKELKLLGIDEKS